MTVNLNRINFNPLLTALSQTPAETKRAERLADWAKNLPDQLAAGLCSQRYGDLPGWLDALNQLPELAPDHIELDSEVSLGMSKPLTAAIQQQLDTALRELIPWRKGPFNLFDININTEWRSDWKWDRVRDHLGSLKGKTILDVGCGNGYHCWRMLGAGAERVIGIDPSPRFVVQFYMVKHFLPTAPVDVLPIGIEALPAKLEAFDMTFSMGVLYHRRSPMDHLYELRDTLRPSGRLVLETLVIDGGLGEVLVPPERYAKMNNVWFLPSVPTLLAWLSKCGFENPRCVDVCTTTTEEQRSTDWMRFHSLPEFLDPKDSSKTVEGHPAPLRAVFIADKKA
jgi:methyltransferase, putative